MLSKTEENYLKAIYSLSMEHGTMVGTNTIAAHLQTKPPCVTSMIKRLGAKSLVDYVRYHGVQLTDQGRLMATKIIRRHRLWEVFLVNHLQFSWDEVHEVAEELEHIKSPKLVERLDIFLGYPTHDPHGDPIPDASGNVQSENGVLLSTLDAKGRFVVVGVTDTQVQFLKYLNRMGLQLGTVLEVLHKESLDGSMRLKIADKEVHISAQLASNLLVKSDL